MEEIIIRYQELPPHVHAMVAEDEEGDYNIYVDPNRSTESQIASVRHELRHIRRGHLRGRLHAVQAEKEASK